MELFLLLSLGMSIIVFISIALNEVPPSQSNVDSSFEPAYSLESNLLASSGIHLLKLEDQVIQMDTEDQALLVPEGFESMAHQPQVMLATSEL